MEKQKIENDQKKSYRWMSRLLYFIGILIGIGMICALLLWRNPFAVRRIDAAETGTVWDGTADGGYIRVAHMDLQFTGFYSVDDHDSLCGYYYIGKIGNRSWFVEVPAKDGDSGLSQAMPDLKDYSFVAQLGDAGDVAAMAGAGEGMAADAYLEYYGISDQIMYTYGTRRGADMLIYAIAVLTMAGCFVAGRLLSDEDKKLKEGQVKTHE